MIFFFLIKSSFDQYFLVQPTAGMPVWIYVLFLYFHSSKSSNSIPNFSTQGCFSAQWIWDLHTGWEKMNRWKSCIAQQTWRPFRLQTPRCQDWKTILLFAMASFQHISRSLAYIQNYFFFWTTAADGCIKYQHKARFISPELWCLLEKIKIWDGKNRLCSSFSVCA